MRWNYDFSAIFFFSKPTRQMNELVGRLGVIDLFCGAGGFTWGWAEAGYTPLSAIDSDVAALRSYELNFGGTEEAILHRDLNVFTPSQLKTILGGRGKELLAITGGPPCQGWSRAGRGKIRSLQGVAAQLLDDPRNQLYRRFLEYLEFFKAPICVMENVPGMLSLEGVNIADAIKRNLNDIGYSCSYGIVNARWFGVPQDRRRLIFFGVRNDLGLQLSISGLERFGGAFRRSVGIAQRTTVRDAIKDLPELSNGASEDPALYSRRPGRPSSYCRLMRARSNGHITDHVVRKHNDQDLEAFGTMAEGMLYAELDQKYKRYRDDIFKDKYRRLYWDRPSWTVTAHLAKDGYSHIHPGQPRTLSIREAARLQSFPDDFRFFGNIGDRFRQIGNAVPPLMAWGIAEFIKQKLAQQVPS